MTSSLTEILTQEYACRPQLLHILIPDLLPLLSHQNHARLLSIGFPMPYLDRLSNTHRYTIACTTQSPTQPWPKPETNTLCCIEETQIPFSDAVFDDVFMVHALEHAQHLEKLLREVWRVLAPAGHLILLVANRRSLHMLGDNSPFTQGRSFSTQQLSHLLNPHLFEVRTKHTRLALPGRLSGCLLDRMLIRLCPSIGGVHVLWLKKIDGTSPLRTQVKFRPTRAFSAS